MWENKFNNRLSLIQKGEEKLQLTSGALKTQTKWLKRPTRAAASGSIARPCDTQRGAPPAHERNRKSVCGDEVSHDGEGSVVTQPCSMSSQSSGHRFSWWLHMDGSCCPMRTDHKVLSAPRGEESLLAASLNDQLSASFLLFPYIPVCYPSLYNVLLL